MPSASKTRPDVILGVFDGTHDAGAALVVDGRLAAACNEERFTRVKGQGGWPRASIAACLDAAGVDARDVGQVAVGGLVNPNPGLRMARRLQTRWRLDGDWFYRAEVSPAGRLSDWLQFDSAFPRLRSDAPLVRAWTPPLTVALRRHLRSTLGGHALRVPLRFLDHHRCHAASAWWTNGADRGLVLVADGLGDGLATTVWQGEGASLRRLAALPYPHSYGLLYATITGLLGFRPFRHEGKLTGLAARGDATAVPLPFPFEGPPDDRRFTLQFGAPLRPWLDQLRACRTKDICAWLQVHLEAELSGLLSTWLARTGLRTVALAGGVVANVRLNQALAALPDVDHLWVFPHMGDGGLAIGAALAAWADAWPERAAPQPLHHAFLGPSWSDRDLHTALQDGGLRVERPPDLAASLAEALADGKLVARFDGAMEVGPRALGHRSILAPTDHASTQRLNQALGRSDFMPFAPLLSADGADDWVEGLAPVAASARFMTVAVNARHALAHHCPAAVHVDNSLRPQLVDHDAHPVLHAMLAHHQRRTGRPAVINTSFNLHEEPIVCSPADAVASFRRAGLDLLAMGPFLASATPG